MHHNQLLLKIERKTEEHKKTQKEIERKVSIWMAQKRQEGKKLVDLYTGRIYIPLQVHARIYSSVYAVNL